MPNLDDYFKIKRCPHCAVDNPNLLANRGEFTTQGDDGTNRRTWRSYTCQRCGGVVTAYKNSNQNWVEKYYPEIESVDDNIPDKPKAFLQQAIDSTFAPAGSVMLCASAVDSMLKDKGYLDGSLYARINKAADEHVITREMAQWAHQVRLDANDQRHADENAGLPTVDDAKKVITFAKALAEFLFVLPSKIAKGIEETKATT